MAIGLARAGADLILVARSADRGRDAVDRIAGSAGGAAPRLLLADLASLDRVRELAADLRERTDRIDVLVNNAGGMSWGHRRSQDGYEVMFAVNHLAPFLLTNLVRPLLEAGPSGRVVTTASGAHFKGRIDFDDPMFEKRFFNPWAAYAQSKLANVLFTAELARRLEGTRVTANCFHPGFVASRFGSGSWPIRLGMTAARPFQVSAKEGADTGIYLAQSAEVASTSGGYFFKRRRRNPSREARDPQIAGRLWDLSERLVGIVG